jgi:hypothetical protein
VELAYVGVIVGNAQDTEVASAVMAGAFVHRIFTWLLPIIAGLVPLAAWGHNMAQHRENEANGSVDPSGDKSATAGEGGEPRATGKPSSTSNRTGASRGCAGAAAYEAGRPIAVFFRMFGIDVLHGSDDLGRNLASNPAT